MQGERAGLASRSLASVVDVGAAAVVPIVGYAGAAAVELLAHPRHFTAPAPSLTQILTVAVIAAVGYLTVCWTWTGRTYGARLLGVRVVRSDGRHLHAFRAFVRAVICVAFPIGLAWCAVDMRRRSVQDLLLRTAVVYDWPEP